jgi:hypothetical protein
MQAWPELRLPDWVDTRDTLHLWTQIVGKTALALAPPVNHWWGVTFRMTPRGFATPLLPAGDVGLQVAFDFHDHVVVLETSDGGRRTVALRPRTVASFFEEYSGALRALGVETHILARPVELPVATPFAHDTTHAAYDAAAVRRFAQVLVHVDRVFNAFRARFLGKCSPVHFFWGSFDVAVTRFSGRPAPDHPGGAPNVADWVMREAYSHECSSLGFWTGGGGPVDDAAFYSYAYPEPSGYAQRPHYHAAMREFVLPYDDVRTAADPDATLIEFCQATYEAAADLGRWDRAALERA